MTVIVSEETGRVSVAYEGKLTRNVDPEQLKEMLRLIQGKTYEEKKSLRLFSKRKADI